MNIIIDTHIFLWLNFEPKKISKEHLAHLEDMGNKIFLSSISIAEIMIKKSIGNLEVDFDIFESIESMGLEVLDFDGKSAFLLGALPLFHRDPFDRMIIAQSLSTKYKIITVDKKFEHYACELI